MLRRFSFLTLNFIKIMKKKIELLKGFSFEFVMIV